MAVLNYLITFYLLAFTPNEAARILAFYPVPSISHQVVFRPLTNELAKRGHEIVVITPDPEYPPDGAPPNITEIDVHDVSYDIWKETFMKTARGSQDNLSSQMKVFKELMITVVDVQLKNEKVQKILQDKNQKFDLYLYEACVRSALILSHIYKIPVIQVSSFSGMFDNFVVIGAPVHTFLYPALTQQRLHNLTLWEKVNQFYNNYLIDKISEDTKKAEYQMVKKYGGSDTPSMDELNNNVDMLFLNVNPIFHGIRPVPPSVVYMGGLQLKSSNELPSDIKSYLDSSKSGVIYISFGTNVDTSKIPADRIQTLIKVFSKLPYDILWKWNDDEMPGRTNNIRISKWLPQSDLLKHPKVKIFITQGGLQSTDESIAAGVPMIGMPMLGDQWHNVERYVYHKIGIRLDIETLTEETLTRSIKTLIEDESYRRNILRLRELMRDQHTQPLERAIWWTEYVIRHGGAKHLRSPAANISWAQYLELELVCVILAVLLAAISILVLVIRFIYQFTIRNYISIKIKQT